MIDLKEITRFRRSLARKYVELVNATEAHHQDAEVFIELVRLGMQCGNLKQQDLLETFRTATHTTVSRWVNGHNLPRSAYRPLLIRKLRDRVAADISDDLS